MYEYGSGACEEFECARVRVLQNWRRKDYFFPFPSNENSFLSSLVSTDKGNAGLDGYVRFRRTAWEVFLKTGNMIGTRIPRTLYNDTESLEEAITYSTAVYVYTFIIALNGDVNFFVRFSRPGSSW